MLARAHSSILALLRWSERYTGTDMVYLASGGMWLGFAQLASSLAALALTVILANVLTPEVFGEYRFLMAGFLLLGVLALPGMHSALIESTAKGFGGNLLTGARTMMRFGLAGSVAALCAAAYYYVQGNLGLTAGFIIIAGALPFFDSSIAYLDYLKALREFRRVASYTALTRVVLVVAVVGAAFTYPAYAPLLFAVFMIANIAPSVLFQRTVARSFHVADAAADPTLVSYAKHLSLMAALGLIALQLDKILVWNRIGAEELALFFIAYTFPQEIQRFLNIIPALAFPKFAVTDKSIVRATLLPKLWKYLIVITAGVAVYLFAAPFIFALIFPKYLAAVPYSQVLMFSLLASAFGPISTYFAATKSTKFLYIQAIIPPAVRIGALLVLVTLFGLWGAVYAILCEAIVRALLLLYLLWRMPQ